MFDKNLQNFVADSPTDPGCYIYRSKSDQVLYVGKAKNIRKRLSQYFHRFEKLDPKIQMMLSKAVRIEFVVTSNEIEALILESNLIKKYKPKYNKDLKDDKKYVWVKVDKDEDFPRIGFSREKNKKADYYGPFPSKTTVSSLTKKLRRIFPYRNCSRKINEVDGKIISSDPKPCLYYHIGLCNAPCAGLVSKNEYRQNINKIKKVFGGKTRSIISDLEVEMKNNSKEEKYEEAAKIRDKINEFKYISQQVIVDIGMDEDSFKEAKSDQIQKALKNLITKINIAEVKEKPDFKIECYDISNIQGRNAVGSMIVFIDGKSKKSHYRKFKIQSKETPDDFHMMQEMLSRRLNRIGTDDISFGIAPDLIIIDGGKGQLSSAFEILVQKNLSIPIISLAKREEEIFKIAFDDDNKIKFLKTILPQKSQELFLVQRIRDEAHRFAITFHRNLRSKSSITTVLDEINGIGEITKKKLLNKFGSVEGIRAASKEELRSIVRNNVVLKQLLKRI